MLGYKAINVYKDQGDGNYAFYKTLHKSPHQDKQLPAPGTSSTYTYKAIYVVHDEEVGKVSPEVSISVSGR